MQRAAASTYPSPNQPASRSSVGFGTEQLTSASSHSGSPDQPFIQIPKKKNLDTDLVGGKSEPYQTEYMSDTHKRSQTDLERVRAALEQEEAKREKAIDRLAAEAGETKWVLSKIESKIGTERTQDDAKRLHIVRAGYAEIDINKGQSPWSNRGRKRFGRHVQDDKVSHPLT